jgi:hypothetical protein
MTKSVKSTFGDRDTVGTIALAAQLSTDIPCVGDLGHELMSSLVEDLNNTIESNPYNNRPFYIIVHEKKDLQLKNVILRRMLTSEKRPYPEPNTSVFYTHPQKEETRFCWALPHKSLFIQVLCNPLRYGAQQINDIKAYQAEDLRHFGFKEVGKTGTGIKLYKPDPSFQDRLMCKKTRVN